jgi:hypothetical protein
MSNSTLHSKSNTWSSRALKVILWFSLAAVFLVVGYLGIGAYVASEVTKIGDHSQFDHTPKTHGVEYQDVRLMARGDGTEIAAWYLPHEGSPSAIILMHGRDASKQNAITRHFLQLGAALHGAGHAVLMIDMRGHAEQLSRLYLMRRRGLWMRASTPISIATILKSMSSW